MFKVIRTFPFQGALEIEHQIFGETIQIEEIPSSTEDELIQNCHDADAIICAYEPITKKVIDALPNLKLIAFGTIGYNYADVDYAKVKGIPVTHITQYCIKEVANYTVSMILMLNQRLLQFHTSVKRDLLWQYDLFPEMRRLDEQTIGFLGFGNIAKSAAERLKTFGPTLIAYDPFIDRQKTKEAYHVELLSMNEVLSKSDFLSIHLPVNDETYQLINDNRIVKMKDGIILINSARGQLVDEQAIIRAIDSGKISYYAADVLSEESPHLNEHPFIKRENIILTPHAAFYSKDALRDGATEWAENVKHFVMGEYDKCNIVNAN